MAQKQILSQTQQLAQQQHLSQQQLLHLKLLEMPLAKLEENVRMEMDDNPALEKSEDYDLPVQETEDYYDIPHEESEEEQAEKAERAEALDEVLQNFSDDDMPQSYHQMDNNNADYEEMVYGDTISFYDRLKEQMDMEEMDDEEHEIMEYLIGSLDNDGLLRKDLSAISDELAVYHNIYADEQKIEQVLVRLQGFDPAGIGARSLQECLLIQIERKEKTLMQQLMKEVIAHHFKDFTKKNWKKINESLHLSEEQSRDLRHELRKLNPKPGASLGETEGRGSRQITPDFIIDSDENGNVSFTINYGDIPQLKVSETFTQMMDTFKKNKENMSRSDKEALLYAKEKVDRASSFIEAVKQRRHTLQVTMRAIINWQKDFFVSGDETELKPMILKDIAEKTGLDISTISRVSNQKYAQTRWGIFPLRHFFTTAYTTEQGEEMVNRQLKLILKEIIDKEDKLHPLSDIDIQKLMADRGYPIARRTVSKYRIQLGIPVARLRK